MKKLIPTLEALVSGANRIVCGFLVVTAILFLAVTSAPARAQSGGFNSFDFDVPPGKSRIQPSTEVPYRSKPPAEVVRFELQAGDCRPVDCDSDRERMQLLENTPSIQAGDEGWYRFSVYLPQDTPNVDPTNLMLAEFKSMGSGQPSLLYEVRGARLIATLSNPEIVQTDRMHPVKPIMIKTISNNILGRWLDVVTHARWSRKADGLIEVYVDGSKVVEHRGPNIDEQATTQGFRYGLYRSFISRYQKIHHVTSLPTQVAYFSNVRKGGSRAEVGN